MNQIIPANEPGRLEALRNYAIVDTLPEIGFDEIAELAAQICGCPAALVSFVDASRQWIKAKYGLLPAELSECPREISICTATICNNDILYVSDLIKDQRFNTSPLVSGDMHNSGSNRLSFNYPFGPGEYRRRDFDAKCLCCFQVDYKLEYGGDVRLAAHLPSLLSEYDQPNRQAAAGTGHSNFAALRICHCWKSF